MMRKINSGGSNWLRAHLMDSHIPNKLLDPTPVHPLERPFMMLLLMDAMLNLWTENQMVNIVKNLSQETVNSFTIIKMDYG